MSGEIGEELENLIERFENAPESRLFAPLADTYRKSGDLDKAIEICEKGLKRYPDYASAHVILGKCFYDKGATERARAEFVRVLELDPENMVALKFMGEILLAEDERGEAAEYLKKLLVIDPMNDEVRKTVEEMEKDFEIKEIDLDDEEKVTRIERPRELATMTLAGIYAAQGYYNKALKIYQEIAQSQPDNKEAHEMVEKLQSIMDKSEAERESVFKEDVMTISLDDVSEEIASSTSGSGVTKEEGGLEEPAAGEVDYTEGLLSGKAPEEEKAEKAAPMTEAGKEAEPPDRVIPRPKDMDDFEAWLKKIKGETEKDE